VRLGAGPVTAAVEQPQLLRGDPGRGPLLVAGVAGVQAASSRAQDRAEWCSQPRRSSRRIRYSGSCLRPRCPVSSRWIRRRTSSTAANPDDAREITEADVERFDVEGPVQERERGYREQCREPVEHRAAAFGHLERHRWGSHVQPAQCGIGVAGAFSQGASRPRVQQGFPSGSRS
jgi:hypothetical protein